MKENYLIEIRGTQEMDGELEEISLSTRGHFARRGANYYITYKESAATGYEGCTTTLKVEGTKKVTMMRYGALDTRMIVEAGRRNQFHYNTDAGSMLFGVSAHEIQTEFGGEGGKVKFSYTLDLNARTISNNEVLVQVRPC
ncbi:DUF1934 domain-containing protein [Ruminococcaceae bacterium OttesenSCG-928-N02]|nr:DUF1934 domain-containing protein [Ruminococcaceae bacterium OttesenSCG-928-N02]